MAGLMIGAYGAWVEIQCGVVVPSREDQLGGVGRGLCC